MQSKHSFSRFTVSAGGSGRYFLLFVLIATLIIMEYIARAFSETAGHIAEMTTSKHCNRKHRYST